jgi:GNAT superfamily N-acetyltransferase
LAETNDVERVAGEELKVILRCAKRTDRKAILRLIESFSPVDAKLAAEDLAECHVAVLDGEVVGVSGIIADRLSARVCWLGWTYVDAKHRGDGIGSQLLRHVEEEVFSRRGKLLFITTSSHPAYLPALRFYESHGYVIAGSLPDYYDVGVDLIALTKAKTNAESRGINHG